jgi:hypothetical protein
MARKRRAKPGPAPESTVPVAPAASAPPAKHRRGLWAAVLLLLGLAIAAGLWLARTKPPAPSGLVTAVQAVALPPPTYVENAQCLGCHQAAGEAWA